MSLTTRCPACATVFRVVPDQLKVSEGWVRCGRCSELFDARTSLSPQVPVVSEVVNEVANPMSEPPPLTDPSTPALAEAPLPAPENTPPAATAQATHPEEPAPAEEVSPLPDASAAPAVEPEPEPEAAAAAPVVDQVSFMRRARRQAFWQRPAVRLVSGSLALLMVLALGAQVTYEYRDELAQRVPALGPALTALCQPLRCRVGPPQRIESITIDTSAFSRLQPDAFRLQFTLANAASLPVALPALELTLTDNQDQAVIRRVLQPADLGADAPATLPSQGEWASAITLTVSPAAAGTISGYRLLAFYP